MGAGVEAPFLVELVAQYGVAGLMFCLATQMVVILAGRVFKIASLLRMSIAVTCGYAAFFAVSQISDSYFNWFAVAAFVFYVTYFLTPMFVDEDKDAITIYLPYADYKGKRK